ncbi:MAG TPA: TRAP transporter TatT component family protein [Polyangiales bacterium]|nr:TRAP transporter TatT component family protein [Polyangiales bacterium]
MPLILLCISGCDLAGLTIKATADGTKEFTDKHGNEFADPEMVGPVLAAGVVQQEGFLYFAPDYEPLLESTIFANVAYGAAWLTASSKDAELNGKFDESEHLQKRASLLYARALVLSKHMLRLRDDGFDTAVAGGLEKFKVWVDENFYEKKDAEVLLVAGIAYFTSMLGSEEGLAAAVDVPYARYMVERSVELDPEVQGAQGLQVLGIYECTIPAMVGGNPQLGKELFERAAKITERKAHSVLVQEAERCAVALQDRKLFHDLLMEVIEAGDVQKYRLPNKLARRQAERLLKQIDDLFYD